MAPIDRALNRPLRDCSTAGQFVDRQYGPSQLWYKYHWSTFREHFPISARDTGSSYNRRIGHGESRLPSFLTIWKLCTTHRVIRLGGNLTNEEKIMTTKTPNLESKSVTFSFDDDGDDLVFELDKCSPEIVTHLAIHGASQKGGDSYAGAKKATEETGADPIDWSRAQVQGVIDQLYAGDWTVRQPGGVSVTDLARALSEATGAPLEDCVEKLSETDKEQKKELRAHPDIKAVLTRLAAERAAKKAEAAEAKKGTGVDLSEFIS
jgi:hypothetical protein